MPGAQGKTSQTQSTSTVSTPSKRPLEDNAATSASKTPRRSPANTSRSTTPRSSNPSRSFTFSPSQPVELTLPQIKRLNTTPYSNCLTFVAKVMFLQQRQKVFDSRVPIHRQKVVFADKYTLMTAFMHTDKNEDASDPKLMAGYSYAITNFRIVKKGELLIHAKTDTEL